MIDQKQLYILINGAAAISDVLNIDMWELLECLNDNQLLGDYELEAARNFQS